MPKTKTIWREKVGASHFDAHDVVFTNNECDDNENLLFTVLNCCTIPSLNPILLYCFMRKEGAERNTCDGQASCSQSVHMEAKCARCVARAIHVIVTPEVPVE